MATRLGCKTPSGPAARNGQTAARPIPAIQCLNSRRLRRNAGPRAAVPLASCSRAAANFARTGPRAFSTRLSKPASFHDSFSPGPAAQRSKRPRSSPRPTPTIPPPRPPSFPPEPTGSKPYKDPLLQRLSLDRPGNPRRPPETRRATVAMEHVFLQFSSKFKRGPASLGTLCSCGSEDSTVSHFLEARRGCCACADPDV